MSEQLTDEQVTQITDALADASKIKAVKLYRDFTGKGLAEAKQFIDELIPKLKAQDPERFERLGEKSAGCASVLLVCLGWCSVLLWWT